MHAHGLGAGVITDGSGGLKRRRTHARTGDDLPLILTARIVALNGVAHIRRRSWHTTVSKRLKRGSLSIGGACARSASGSQPFQGAGGRTDSSVGVGSHPFQWTRGRATLHHDYFNKRLVDKQASGQSQQTSSRTSGRVHVRSVLKATGSHPFQRTGGGARDTSSSLLQQTSSGQSGIGTISTNV